MKKVGITNNDSFIGLWDDVFTQEECKKTVEHLEWVFTKHPELLHVETGKTRRDNAMFLLDKLQTSEIAEKVIQRIYPCWNEYCEIYDHPREYYKSMNRSIKAQKSSTDGGYVSWHHEQGISPLSQTRYAVWMMYLNDNFEGGFTQFQHQELAIEPKAGSLLIWPASFTHRHRAAPDLVGDKWIVTGWFSYQPEDEWLPQKYRQ